MPVKYSINSILRICLSHIEKVGKKMLCQNHTEFETHIFEMWKTENHTIYLVSFLCEFGFF